MPQSDIAYLANMIERELAKPGFGKKTDPELLAIFDSENARLKTRETIISGLLALCVYNAFLISDNFYRTMALQDTIFIRVFAVTIPCLIGLWLVRKGQSEPARNIMIAFASIMVTLGAAVIFLRTPTPVAIYDPFAFVLVPILTNNLLPIRFRYALFATLIDVAIMTAVILISPVMPKDATPMALSTLYVVGAITLVANYRLERGAITNFLNLLLKSLRQIEMNEANRYLKIIAREDPLTGLANRREFEAALARTWDTAVDGLDSYSVLMIDIDYFKSYNDRHGHPAGDECLRVVARIIQQQIRSSNDIAARLGGEEFCILMPGAPLQAVENVAERIREAIEKRRIPHGGMPGVDHVTVSIGAANAIAKFCRSGDDLVSAADKALYEAKRSGRNQNRITRIDIAA